MLPWPEFAYSRPFASNSFLPGTPLHRSPGNITTPFLILVYIGSVPVHYLFINYPLKNRGHKGVTMSKNITAARRKEIESIITRWKLQREAIHDGLEESLYSDHALQIEEQDFPIEEFCESLMDYISTGHFEVYETLLAEGLHESSAELEANRKILEEIYHSIETTTDLALSFNDKYKNELVHSSEDASLPKDLIRLDNALTLRFALEDQLLELTR